MVTACWTCGAESFYESWDFTILRRSELGWLRTYRGGGGGC